MKNENEFTDTLGNTICPSMSIPFISEGNSQTPQRVEVALYIKQENGEEALICLDVETAILLTDKIQHLTGQILLDEARDRIKSND